MGVFFGGEGFGGEGKRVGKGEPFFLSLMGDGWDYEMKVDDDIVFD